MDVPHWELCSQTTDLKQQLVLSGENYDRAQVWMSEDQRKFLKATCKETTNVSGLSVAMFSVNSRTSKKTSQYKGLIGSQYISLIAHAIYWLKAKIRHAHFKEEVNEELEEGGTRLANLSRF